MNWFTHAMDWFCLEGRGYQFWSGIGSDFGEVTIIGGLLMIYRHHQCHVDGCRLPGHLDPEVHAPACRLHHSHRRKRGRVVE